MTTPDNGREEHSRNKLLLAAGIDPARVRFDSAEGEMVSLTRSQVDAATEQLKGLRAEDPALARRPR